MIPPAIAEVLGRSDGFAGGKGGSMHFVDPSLGLMGANGIVGAPGARAAGMALSSNCESERIAITFLATAQSIRASCTRPSTLPPSGSCP